MKGSFANRGMGLESLIEYANAQYASKGIANIQKISTPWQIVRQGKKIVNAFPTGPSTVDYMGEYKGAAICFEAKETGNKTSFPLSNFEQHQIEFIRRWQGISFAIVHFSFYNRTFFIYRLELLRAWDNQKTGRKSIPYTWITQYAKEVTQGNGIVLDYLRELSE